MSAAPSATVDRDPELFHEERGAGPAVLLLHGWGTSRRVWDAQLAALTPGHRTVTVDWRGCGASARLAAGATFEQATGDLLAVMDALGLAAPVIVGSSLGGAFALELARTAPERVAGVVAVASPGHRAVERGAELAALRAALHADRRAALQAWVPHWFGPRAEPGMVAETMGLIRGAAEHVDEWLAVLGRYDPREWLPRLSVPVEFVHGALDAEIPVAVAEESAALVPGGRLTVVPDAGHMVQMERPGEFDAVLAAALRRIAAAGRDESAAGA